MYLVSKCLAVEDAIVGLLGLHFDTHVSGCALKTELGIDGVSGVEGDLMFNMNARGGCVTKDGGAAVP